jgi:Na+-translocating ferredoxin:NAD+ oxidoreductase RNF subunit RnfB
LIERLSKKNITNKEAEAYTSKFSPYFTERIPSKPVMKLDEDIAVAIRKMEMMERIYKDLPGLDCGSCGSPSCRTLAEDIVRGQAVEMDCIFKLREKVKYLAQQMIDFSNNIPTVSDGRKENES